MVEISASLLSLNKENAIRKFYDLETAKINYFHIDVMDGKFVDNNNMDLMKEYAVSISHISNLGLDVHLMVENIEEMIEEYIYLNPKIMTFHIEATKNEDQTEKIIKEIKQNGTKVGIAISPQTSIDEIKKYINKIHLILIMSVYPGKGGQKFIPSTLEKIKELKEYIDKNNIDIDIEVDGGINDITSKEVVKVGANILVAGSYITSSEDYKQAVKNLL